MCLDNWSFDSSVCVGFKCCRGLVPLLAYILAINSYVVLFFPEHLGFVVIQHKAAMLALHKSRSVYILFGGQAPGPTSEPLKNLC